MDKKRRKKQFAAAAFLLVAAGAGMGSTLSYFSDSDLKVNTFTTGDLDIDLKEPEWDPQEGDGKDLYPGKILYKNPTVKNVTDEKNGPQPCYVRMILEILDKDGKAVLDETARNLIWDTIYFDQAFDGTFDKRGSSENLTENKSPGFCLEELSSYPMVNPAWEKDTLRSTASKLVYTYKGKEGDHVLNPGQESTLFTNVVIPTDWTEEEMEAASGTRLKITAEAIQCQGFSQAEDGWEIMDQNLGKEELENQDKKTDAWREERSDPDGEGDKEQKEAVISRKTLREEDK